MKRAIRSRFKLIGTALAWLAPITLAVIWLVLNPQQTLAMASFVREHSMVLMFIRWSLYGALLLAWPTIARRAVNTAQRSAEQAESQYQTLLAWRWPIARLLVVYELLFPLNILAKLGAWL